MPLINPVVIGGKVVGAYVDETYAINGQGKATLTELLQYILDAINGGGFEPTANNGLNVDANVVQMGGELIENTVVGQNGNFALKIGKEAPNDSHYLNLDPAAKISIMYHEDATHVGFQGQQATGWGFTTTTKSTGNNGTLTVGHDLIDITVQDLVTPNLVGFYIAKDVLSAQGIRTYASVAAAQADITAPTGTLYRLNADSVLRIKTL